jgi:hypothetical protein
VTNFFLAADAQGFATSEQRAAQRVQEARRWQSSMGGVGCVFYQAKGEGRRGAGGAQGGGKSSTPWEGRWRPQAATTQQVQGKGAPQKCTDHISQRTEQRTRASGSQLITNRSPPAPTGRSKLTN